MRIAVWHNLPSGGGNRALYDQVRGLVGRGHHVEIWCPPTANRSFLPLGGYVQEHVLPMDLNVGPNRLPLIRKLKTYCRATSGVMAMEAHCRACAVEIERGGFDVLLAHPSMEFHPTPIGRLVKIPSAIYLQEPNRGLYEAMPHPPGAASPRRDGRPLLEHWQSTARNLVRSHSYRLLIREEWTNAAGFDLILVNSMFSRESLLRAYGLDARVCYLGIDLASFRPSDSPKEGFVVGLGSIDWCKRPDVALEALGTIEAEVRPELVWIGNYANASYLEFLKRRASELGVRFRHEVNVPQSALVETLGRASAMIYTSRLEPFGYAPLEANACGTAVVAIAEGGVRETVRDGLNGTLLMDSQPAALGRAVLDYCSDPEKARAVGLAARRNVEENWGLDASVDRLERQLATLVPAGTSVPG